MIEILTIQDDFITYILIPFVMIMFQLILIVINIYTLREEHEDYALKLSKIILWFILSLMVPSVALSSMILASPVSLLSGLGYILFCLLLLQLLININHLLKEKRVNSKTSKKRRYK